MVAANRLGAKFDDGASGRVVRVTRALSGLPGAVAATVRPAESAFVVSALGFRRRCEVAYMTDTPLDATLRALVQEWGEAGAPTSAGLRAVLAGAILSYLDLACWGEPEIAPERMRVGAAEPIALRESASRLVRALLATLAVEYRPPLEETNITESLFGADALAAWQLGRDARLAREIATRAAALARTTDALGRESAPAERTAA